ncbi:MAG: SDR family oxidoreductase [Cellulomonadaceae bacterium]|nr:SDR family oxidoreductase [Cellulomonadaceae bacterium]
MDRVVDVPRTAVVTGAGRGIGAGIAAGLARAGYRVALLGRTRANLEAVADQIEAEGARAAAGAGAGTGAPGGPAPRPLVVPVELTDAGSVREAAAQAVDGLGEVGLLVNNAGVIEHAELPFAADDVEDVWRVVETNVRGPLLMVHALLPGMLVHGRGRIVMINSGAGHRGSTTYTGYGISKGALARLTTMLDTQYRDDGLRVFDVAPGVVATDMTASMPVHRDRTAWTPVQATVDLLLAIGAGDLDALSGRFLRAGDDTVAELEARTYEILVHDARRLRLVPYGPTDPLIP